MPLYKIIIQDDVDERSFRSMYKVGVPTSIYNKGYWIPQRYSRGGDVPDNYAHGNSKIKEIKGITEAELGYKSSQPFWVLYQAVGKNSMDIMLQWQNGAYVIFSRTGGDKAIRNRETESDLPDYYQYDKNENGYRVTRMPLGHPPLKGKDREDYLNMMRYNMGAGLSGYSDDMIKAYQEIYNALVKNQGLVRRSDMRRDISKRYGFTDRKFNEIFDTALEVFAADGGNLANVTKDSCRHRHDSPARVRRRRFY